MRRRIALTLCLVSIFFLSIPVWGVDYDAQLRDIKKESEELTHLLELNVAATNTNEKQMKEINSRIESIRAKIQDLEKGLEEKSAEIDKGDEELARTQKILSSKVAAHYKNLMSKQTTLLNNLLSRRLTDFIHEAVYQGLLVEKDQKHILGVATQIQDLEAAHAKLANQKSQLQAFKNDLSQQSRFLAGEIASAKDYQAQLNKKIAELSVRQEAIIAARSAQVSASVGESDLTYDDFNASREYSPGFSPAFAVFSIGAYTHRNGMSQYGAKGRANMGQSAEQILAHYYPGATLNKNYTVPETINVEGYGVRAFEDEYMQRIYEMPNSFPKEALKAQAVAARTYAIRRGGSICATEACQVYKDQNKGGAWEEAVKETRGWVLEGGPSAQYSSTTGGYLNTSGWDTTDGQGNNFLENAWERQAQSPWFYKGWYRANYSNSSDSCGRSSPWLTEKEFVDILNAWIVRGKGSQDEVSRILPTTINTCNVGGMTGNPYTEEEMAQAADRYGGRVSSVSSVATSFSASGDVSQVTVQTNKGALSLGGGEFKQIFNLRAPGYLSIRNVLFNVEKK